MLSEKPPRGSLDEASVPWLIVKANGSGTGEIRISRNTSVNVGSAFTVRAFWPSPPLRSSTTCSSCDVLPATDESTQLASMCDRKRCFFTVAYSKCSESNAVTAGRS